MPPGETRFARWLTLAFALVVAVGLAGHEMWRDELQAWMIVRDVGSLAELFAVLRYEGHPAAWYLLLLPIARVVETPVAMQVVHLALAAGAVWVMARFAPLPRHQRVLVAFGYFVAFEYAVVSRAYVLGELLLFVACALLAASRRSYLALGVVLVLLANTSVYGAFLAIALGVGVLAEWAASREARTWALARPRALLLAVLLAVGGLAGAVATMIPEPQRAGVVRSATADESAPLDWSIAVTASLVARTYAPLPRGGARTPWGAFLIEDGGSSARLKATLALSVALVGVFALAFLRRPLALVFYLSVTGALLAFALVVFFGSLRHHGHFFLALVAAVWLARARLPLQLPAPIGRVATLAERAAGPLFTLLLVLQLPATLYLYAADATRPFSGARATAAFLEQAGANATLVVVAPSPAGSAVAAWLERPVYYLRDDLRGTFVRWRDQRAGSVILPEEAARLCTVTGAGGRPVLFATAAPLPAPPPCALRLDSLAHFRGALVPEESYTVYRVERAADRGGP